MMIPFLPLEGESGDVDPLESDPLDVSPFVHLLDGVTHLLRAQARGPIMIPASICKSCALLPSSAPHTDLTRPWSGLFVILERGPGHWTTCW